MGDLAIDGVETRNTCTAGYKAMVQDGDFPSRAYFKALDPQFENVVDEMVGRDFAELGSKAGELKPEMAALMGLRRGSRSRSPMSTPMSARPPSKRRNPASWCW